MHWTKVEPLALLFLLPCHTGEGREGESRTADLDDFRSEMLGCPTEAFPLPTLPHMTGEEMRRESSMTVATFLN
jgi:hypothetical protein